MTARQAWVQVMFACELPDDDAEADTAFDTICDGIAEAVAAVPRVYDESVSVSDGDTVTP